MKAAYSVYKEETFQISYSLSDELYITLVWQFSVNQFKFVLMVSRWVFERLFAFVFRLVWGRLMFCLRLWIATVVVLRFFMFWGYQRVGHFCVLLSSLAIVTRFSLWCYTDVPLHGESPYFGGVWVLA